jgi:SAM-dependent methyltransferase
VDALWLIVVGVVGLFSFAAVLLVGAPYLPTLRPQVLTGLDLLHLKKGQTVLELGCGDGRVLLEAARRGHKAVGIELNPLLFTLAWLRTWPYRSDVRVIWGDMWQVTWPEADGVYTFLLDRFMPRLDRRMRTYKKPLVSVAFQVRGLKPDKASNGVFLYRYDRLKG